jgi:anti-anti-sigma factor
MVQAQFSVRAADPRMFMLAGELDMATRPILDQAIVDAVLAGGPIVLDLSAVTFMDAAGVHAIIDATDGLPSGCILLHGVRGDTAKLLGLVGIDQMPRLHIVPCTENPAPAPVEKVAV